MPARGRHCGRVTCQRISRILGLLLEGGACASMCFTQTLTAQPAKMLAPNNENDKKRKCFRGGKASDFCEGVAAVQVGRKFAFVDGKGRMVVPASFDEAGDFHDGLAGVRVGSQYGFISR